MSSPSGQVYLCKNAIVDRNYTHTIDFKSPSEQLAYWGSLVKYPLTNFTYIRRQRQFIRVDKTLDELQDINYLYYRATENSKMYYCFVTDKEYFSDNTSYIYFETDVLQSYMFDYEVKQSYVLQEHCDRWDANHKPIYSRTEENLDYGPEYTVESAYKIDSDSDNGLRWYLAICTNPGELIDEGADGYATKITNVTNPYTLYLLPGSAVGDVVDGSQLQITIPAYDGGTSSTTSVLNNITLFSQMMDKSTLGANVMQIVKLRYLPFNFYITNHDSGAININCFNEKNVEFGITTLKSSTITGRFLKIISIENSYEFVKKLAEMNVFEGVDSAIPTKEQWEEITNNPYTTERDKRFESKLLTYPYRYNLLTDWKSQSQIIKNEYIGGDKIQVNFTQCISFNSPVRYWIENYRKDPEGRSNSVIQLVPEECPVINDAYYNYMLSNKNQISANQTNAITSSIANIGTGLVSGIFGGAVGSILGATTGAIGGAVNYQNMIRSENAKQKDLKNVPDTIINSNDCGFNIMDNNEHLTFYRMKICCEFEELLADTFAMTGYTVKRVKIPNLKTRARYNYIKTVGANIIGSFDQNDLNLIRAIFDNGVTFWHYNTVNFKPFDYSLENIETKLIKG